MREPPPPEDGGPRGRAKERVFFRKRSARRHLCVDVDAGHVRLLAATLKLKGWRSPWARETTRTVDAALALIAISSASRPASCPNIVLTTSIYCTRR